MIIDEIKNTFRRPNNALKQLIVINVIVFVIMGILAVIAELSGFQTVFAVFHDQFMIPPLFGDFIRRPWTLFTYSFTHSLVDFLHIIFNMLGLYWFGRLITEYLGSRKLVALYILGGVAGGLAFLFFFNFVPYFQERALNVGGMVGASAAVYAIAVAAATLLPDYSFYLIFIGPVKIKYIVMVYIFFSFLGIVGANAGGNIAHLGGAVVGYFFISQLKRGRDLGRPVNATLDFFKSFFVPRPKIRVSYNSRTDKARTEVRKEPVSKTDQQEIDAILDKISAKGYSSLTKEEKEKLFKASKK